MKVFFDTNVLVYLFDSGSPRKQARAQELLGSHTDAGELLLSTQVLQEFYVAATRKLATPLDEETAYATVRELATLPVVQIDAGMVLAAIQRSRRNKLSLWDALVVQAAIEGGASTLYTEDLQDGAVLDGLRIVDPFR